MQVVWKALKVVAPPTAAGADGNEDEVVWDDVIDEMVMSGEMIWIYLL